MKTIALAGNPNCGKTSIFNLLTKTRQHVGNWPGVTVEKKEGILKYKGKDFNIVDLPGTYSLGAYSEDEVVARNFIINDKPDLVLNIVDSTNLERNLYLTMQLLEMGIDVIIALNIIDEARTKGIKIDVEALSEELGVKIIETSALKGEGIEKLIEEITKDGERNKKELSYGDELEGYLDEIESVIKSNNIFLKYPSRWLAIKLLENDEYIKNIILNDNTKELEQKIVSCSADIEENLGFDGEIAIVDKRYEIISKIIKGTVVKEKKEVETKGDKIDRIVTNKYLGIPIFALIMFLLYQITFTIGATLQEYTEGFIAFIGEKVVGYIEGLGAPDMFLSFLNDGVFGGIAAVISFLPLIMVMYLLIGVLEDSGYMARAAYVMDRIMRKLGLHGKTFVSMIVSIGCNVPGIMATRTLDNKKDRMIAILINPFISCGARLPIYALFVSAFFDKYQALILFLLYVLGIIVALIAGKIFSKTLFKGETSYFVMELPTYKMPSLKNIVLLMWDKAGAFLKKAGILILPAMIVLWVLGTFPIGVEQYSENSLLGIIGRFVALIFNLAGFGNWQASVSLITGVLAKETVVATMGLVYSGIAEGPHLVTTIQSIFTPLTAMSFMVMTLLYTPCLVALGAIKRETNSWKWTIFTAVYTFLVGLLGATLVYQIGSLLGFS